MLMVMHVAGLILDTRTGRNLVVVADEGDNRAIVIAVGLTEAIAINDALQNKPAEHPLTHDLLIEGLEQAGYQITQVEIGADNANTCLASIHLNPKNQLAEMTELRSLDARPSDAIALAIRAHVPIVVSQQLFASGSISLDLFDENEPQSEYSNGQTPGGYAAGRPSEYPAHDEDFSRFLENVKASDFHLDGPSQFM
jgi:uncharacterized protein